MKYNKGFAPVVILLIVLGVLAVSGVAYFAGKSSAPKNKVSDNSNYFPTTEQNYTPPTTNNNPTQQQTPPPANNPPKQQPSSSTKNCSNAGMSVTVPNQPNYKCNTEVARVYGNTAVAVGVGYWSNLSSINGKEVISIYKFANQAVFNENSNNIDYTLVNSSYPISGTTGLYYEGNANIGSDNKRIVVPSQWIIISIDPASYIGISQTILDSITNSISF
jgi:hypothetical protein